MKFFIVQSLVTFSVVILCFGITGNNNGHDCPRIKSKQQWEAVLAKRVTNLTIPVQYVIIHHTVSKECESFQKCATILQNIQSYHMLKKNFDDIGYNFMVGNDGLVYEGRGWNKIGNHTRDLNQDSIGIAFIGNFTSHLPAPRAFIALKQLLHCGLNLGVLTPNYNLMAARQVANTISPGLPIFGEIQQWDNWTESFKFPKIN